MRGTLNCIWGIAAIDGSTFFVEDAKYILEDINTMGWVVLGIGVLELVAFPLWSVCVFALNVLVIYGLAAYGGRQARAT